MISHHQKCVFVHIPKTAGQSVEHVFLNLLGLDWRTRAPLLLRPNDCREIGPPALAHLAASEYVLYKYLTQELFDNYFKFSFVRSPWTRLISTYSYLGFEKKCEFKRFVMEILENEIWDEKYWFLRPQNEFLYSADGGLIVDFVGKFENLQKDFDEVCARLQLRAIELPHVNKSRAPNIQGRQLTGVHFLKSLVRRKQIDYGKKFSRYQDYYDSETLEVVQRLYGEDIELFNYTF